MYLQKSFPGNSQEICKAVLPTEVNVNVSLTFRYLMTISAVLELDPVQKFSLKGLVCDELQ